VDTVAGPLPQTNRLVPARRAPRLCARPSRGQPGIPGNRGGTAAIGGANARVVEFDEAEFFRAIAASGARALLIGRRALVALGIPVLTADYDFWLHIDDVAVFNVAVEPQGLLPTRTPDEARGRGRYVLENDERVDVLVGRIVPTVDGVRVAFEDVWPRRRTLEVAAGVAIAVPALDDLILTKRFGGRPKDLEDIRLLEALRREQP
jgi:hypothetical protein